MRRDSSREDDRPSFQFYPADWLRDEALKLCSLAAQGLWIHLLSRAHYSPERGVILRPNGQPAGVDHITTWTGKPPEVVEACLTELLDERVASRRDDPEIWPPDKLDDAVYCRRAVKDERIRKIRADAGRKGGLSTQAKPRQRPKQTPSKPAPTQPPTDVRSSGTSDASKGQAPEDQKSTPSSSSASSPSKEQQQKAQRALSGQALKRAIEKLLSDWNAVAEANGYRRAEEIEPGTRRCASAGARLKSKRWRERYAEALQRLKPTAFLTGQTERGWKATIDWFIRPGKVTEILEGTYDDGGQQERKISRE